MNKKLKVVLNNLVKPIEIAPDGFLLAVGAAATSYFFRNDYVAGMIGGASVVQYLKGVQSYAMTYWHIKKHNELNDRFVERMHDVYCFRFGMRCAVRNNGQLENYLDIVSKL